jgi:ribosomal protein L40E
MKCSSCGTENPPEAVFCLKCGKRLAGARSDADVPAKEFMETQARSAVTKMLETPGTIVLALGLFLLIASLLLMIASLWVGLGLLAVSIIVLLVAVQLRGHEARIAQSQASNAPTVLQSEIREREIVKVKCRYCGALNPDGAKNCGSCGAVL